MYSNLLLASLLLISEGLAAATTKTFVTCVTKHGPKSTSKVHTTSKVLTIPVYGYKVTTVTPKKTVTPKATTITVQETSTSTTVLTLPKSTDTFSSTSTLSFTETITETDTESVTTTTVTTTTSTPTNTITPSAGFTPIRTSIPNSAKKREELENPPVEQELDPRGASKTKYTFSIKNGKPVCSPPIFPTAVTCAGVVKVISTSTVTKTAKKTRTIVAPRPTSTATQTITEVATNTETPIHASTTLSFTTSTTVTETNTQSTTTTVTETQTIQVIAPMATFYAACGSDNMISSVGGSYIDGALAYNPNDLIISDASTPYDCCVSCQNSATCGGSVFVYGFCVLGIRGDGGACRQDEVVIYALTGGSSSNGYASNGNCGYVAAQAG